MSIKIAFIIPKLANQGPILVVNDLINEIKDKVILIDVYYFDYAKEIELPCNSYKISFRDKIDFDKYDIIHSHMLRPDLYIWLNKRNIKKAKCISTLHQDIFANLKYTYNCITAFIFEKIWITVLKVQDVVVTLTKTMSEQYQDKLEGTALFTIYNGRSLDKDQSFEDIDGNDKAMILRIKSKYKIIGVSALLTKRKGVSQLINALPYLKEYAVIIIGDGEEKAKLIELSEKLNLQDRCLFLGYKFDAYRYLVSFDIYAMSSYSEGFPLSLLEAAQYRLPIVCSDLKIFRELFNEDEVSYFELDNVKSLVNAILHLDKNCTLFSNNVFERVSKDYSVEKMAGQYLCLYNNVLLK